MGMREFQARFKALEQINDSAVNMTALATAVRTQGANYDVLHIALINDVNKVRAFPSLAARAEYKRNYFLPKWLSFIDEYLQKGEVYQNDYFIYCIIYLFDIGDFEQALRLSDIAIEQNQSMPEQFKSALPTFVADQIYHWANKTAMAGGSVEPYFSQTLQNVATKWQLHELITAKWLKFAAALLLRDQQGKIHAASVDDPECLILAIQLCNRAFQLHHKIGVKTMIERCLMRLSALQEMGKINATDSTSVSGLSLETQQIDFDIVAQKLRSRHSLSEGLDNV